MNKTFIANAVREEMNIDGQSEFFSLCLEIEADNIDAAKSDAEERGYEVLEIHPKLRLI